jgi:hypothetical protein
MRSRVLGAATFFLCLQLLATASAHAQGQQPPTPPKARPSYSSIEHNVITWFHRVTRADTHRHRIASSPPLPRPRPTQLTKAPELPATAVEPKGTQPVSTAIEPNEISPAPALKVEPDKAPTEPPAASVEPNELPPAGTLPAAAIEPNEAQPAASAGEPNTISSTPTVEPAKTPAELPPGAVEQTKAPDIPAGIVLQGANIPD